MCLRILIRSPRNGNGDTLFYLKFLTLAKLSQSTLLNVVQSSFLFVIIKNKMAKLNFIIGICFVCFHETVSDSH